MSALKTIKAQIKKYLLMVNDDLINGVLLIEGLYNCFNIAVRI